MAPRPRRFVTFVNHNVATSCTAPDGVYGLAGSNDANDPNAVNTVLDPALGQFIGRFSGVHASGTPERIAGDWDLMDAAALARCTGPFMVELQP